MTTPDLSLGALPGDAQPDATLPETPETPVPPVEEREDNRRKKFLLLFLLGLLAIMGSLSIWYLLFRQPITTIPVPFVEPPMPTYQGSLYDLSKPQAVAVSPDGAQLVVTQTGTTLDTVLMDRQGTQLAILKPPADLIAQAHQLFVATDPATGDYWTTDRFNGAVAIYDANGKYLSIFDQGVALANWQPLGIGFDQAGNAYIADVSADPVVIHVFGSDGKLVRDFGAGAGLNHPNGIAVDADGTVYVTDTANGRLLVFDASGAQVGIVERGDAVGNLGLPVGIGIDDHGRILVADSSASKVQAYTPMATGDRGPGYVNSFGEKGASDGAFSFPNGLAVDGRGRVYVADWGNDRLEVWSY